MDSKSRMLKAWDFEEPDRVPLEMYLYPPAKGLPGADKISEFQEKEADNFRGVPGFDWGFLGLDNSYKEEVIEDIPGDFKRLRRTYSTPEGEFTAVTKHFYGDQDPNDYYWEKRYIDALDDFRRIAGADRTVRPFNLERYNQGCAKVGNRGLPSTTLFHPLGRLVRNSSMDEVYMWLVTEERLAMQFLEKCTEQICATLLSVKDAKLADPPVFMTAALEMLIPPWFGKEHFNKLVFPFDKRVNDAVHKIGGRHRAHCHGNSGEFLELFADMGVDAVEPLEPPPYGDNIIVKAKQQVGKRMLLSGNVVSQDFHLDSFKVADVRDLVKKAVAAGAPGGGFSLKTTGGAAGNGKTKEQCIKDIDCNLALIDAWREFSLY
ncbi:MAG: uroporphyrinogen decarboxylase family protein [Kiritimatiellae bacterium]|nr:uroporphyrinogen decarboxylase family protein [Kiritimatiellia bacterium]